MNDSGIKPMTRSPALNPQPGDVLFVSGTKLAVTWHEDGIVGYKRHNTNYTTGIEHWRQMCAFAMVLENADLKGKE